MKKNKAKILITALAIFAGGFVAYETYVLNSEAQVTGPGNCAAGTCQGALGVNSAGNIGVGAGADATSRLFVSATSTLNRYAIYASGTALFTSSTFIRGGVYASGTITVNPGAGTAPAINIATGTLKFADGTTQTTAYGGGSATLLAGNVAAGQFGQYQGGGLYTFPSGVAMNGATASALYGLTISGTVQRGLDAQITGTAANNYGVIGVAAGAGTVNYGIYAGATAGGTNYSIYVPTGYPAAGASNYSIYSNSAAQSYFAGSVGVGVTAPATALEVAGSTSNSSIKTGAYEIQGYGINNNWSADNLYYSGGWKYRDNGYAAQIYYNGGDILVQTSPSNAGGAGATATLSSRLTIKNTGNVGIASSTPGSLLSVQGNIKIGGTGTLIFPDGTSQSTAAVAATNYWARSGTDTTLANTGDNVGIGMTPAVKLSVSGNIGATGWVGAGCEGNCSTSGGYSLIYDTGQAGFYDGTNSFTLAPNTATYGSFKVTGSKNGYAGINFVDQDITLMMNTNYQGAYNTTAGTWDWYFTNGALTAGSVPWTLVTGKPIGLANMPSTADGASSAWSLAWKNYANHMIVDMSAGTAPDGSAHSNTTPDVAWSATYPTLMGWNGGSTYGVRTYISNYADALSSMNISQFTNNSGYITNSNANYYVTAGNGNGICFWGDCTNYKMAMGSAAEYVYGPVSDYSIKSFMNSTAGRGWTWGQPGIAPIAAISNTGASAFAGTMTIGGGTGKINVGTVDPIYTISGTKYATYLPGMTGQKEETAGTLACNAVQGACEKKIDFRNLEKGSDLWLFAQATNLAKNKDNFEKLTVLLTPAFDGKVWYKKDSAAKTLTVYAKGDGELEISYRLTAPRFDSANWTNYSHDTEEGFNLDELLKN